MRRIHLTSVFLLSLLFAASAFADSVSGNVTNATTGKPAAGTTITLVDPMGGMAEIASAKSDAQGHFKVDAPAAQGPRLVRAEKGGVNYFKMLTPGSTSVDITVYDASSSVTGISGAADVVRLQAQGSTLQAVELFAIKNASTPPRTLASASTFEFIIPDGAQLDGADAQGPNGQPISVTPTPTKEKNRYALSYALKPGETRFQVSYHMSYSGQMSVTPHLTRDFEHYVMSIPSTMSFAAKDGKLFQPMTNQPGSLVEVVIRPQQGQDLTYTVSGTGSTQDEDAQASQGGSPAMGGSGANDNRPGGGLGKPIDAPDGLAKYRWYILGLLLTILVGGGIWTHERTKQAEAEDEPVAPRPVSSATQPSARRGSQKQTPQQSQPASGNLLLAALKEELFELEVERQQGKIKPDEYDKARAALEQTIQRALTRTKS